MQLKNSPEVLVLISCIKNFFSDELIHINDNVDWHKLLKYSSRHKITILVYHVLKKNNWETNDTIERWSLVCKQKQKKCLFITGELFNLLNCCQKKQIAPISFKGPAFAKILYGDLGVREYSDIDILVTKEHLSKLEEILTEKKFLPSYDFDSTQHKRFLQHYHAISWRNKYQSIDIHCQLHPKYFGIYLNKLPWKDNLQTVFSDKLTFSNEIYLLYICTHAMRHRWQNLVAVCDIAQLIKICTELDWQKVLSYADQTYSCKMLYIGLILCEKIASVQAPEVIRKQFKNNKKLYKKANRFIDNIHLSKKPSLFVVFSAHDNILVNLLSIILYIFRPLPKNIQTFKLPEKLFWIYSIIPVFYFVYKYFIYYPIKFILRK